MTSPTFTTELERELYEALGEFVAATDDYVTSEPDMPSHRETERRYEIALGKANIVLSRARGETGGGAAS